MSAFRLLPGLGLAAAVALAARGAHALLPAGPDRLVGEAILAILFGLLLGPLLPAAVGIVAQPGVRAAARGVLQIAIVLLGASLSFATLAAIGGRALVLIVALMGLALGVAHALAGLLGVPSRLATLIGVGTAVCGNSAIVAAGPIIGAEDDEVAFAIAANTLCGTIAVFLYPLLGHAAGMSDAAFGTWAGTAVNDTSQVVAASFAYSDAAGGVATVVKLTRNALMGPVLIGLGLLHAGAAGRSHAGAGGVGPRRLLHSVPPFVLGFLALAAIHSAGGLAWASRIIASAAGAPGFDLERLCQEAARLLIVVALAGVGLGTRFGAMRRIGLRPLLIGLAAGASTAVASYLWIAAVGAASVR